MPPSDDEARPAVASPAGGRRDEYLPRDFVVQARNWLQRHVSVDDAKVTDLVVKLASAFSDVANQAQHAARTPEAPFDHRSVGAGGGDEDDECSCESPQPGRVRCMNCFNLVPSTGGGTGSSENAGKAPSDVPANHSGCEGASGPAAEQRVLSPLVAGSSPAPSLHPSTPRTTSASRRPGPHMAGCTTEDCSHPAHRAEQVARAFAEGEAKGRAEEREACAKLAETFVTPLDPDLGSYPSHEAASETAHELAARIRAREARPEQASVKDGGKGV